MFSIQNRDDK